jgi:DHA1 family multidrug resistance protein-like MFS transporter
MQTLRLPLWRRNQFTIILTIFVTVLGFYFVTPFLPLYLQDLGVGDPRQAALWAGLTLGVAPLLTSIASPFWGMMADRYGYKLMLQRSLVLFVLITVLMGLARHPWQLFVLRAAHGLLGGFGALSMTLVSITAPQDRMSEAMSMVQSARVLGAAVGPIMGGVLADSLGIRYSFFVTAGMCALALLIIT